jgi:hypothetical protein
MENPDRAPSQGGSDSDYDYAAREDGREPYFKPGAVDRPRVQAPIALIMLLCVMLSYPAIIGATLAGLATTETAKDLCLVLGAPLAVLAVVVAYYFHPSSDGRGSGR